MKATFRLRPDLPEITDVDAEPISERDVPVGNDGGSLSRSAELVPGKSQPEVLLVGSAFAPDELPVQSLIARLAVGGVVKSVEVFGERWWQPDETLGQPTPWLSFPLMYEHAAGGPATWNPVGVAVATSGDELNRRRAPSLVLPGASPRSPSATSPVACFAPIPASWPIRAERAEALRRIAVAQTLDAESDLMIHQAAPTDQFLDDLDGDETIKLEHLVKGSARLVFRLPGVAPRSFIPGAIDRSGRRLGTSTVAHLDTITIDTDREIMTLLWRTRHKLSERENQSEFGVEWTKVSEDPELRMAQDAILSEVDGQTFLNKRGFGFRDEPTGTDGSGVRAARPAVALHLLYADPTRLVDLRAHAQYRELLDSAPRRDLPMGIDAASELRASAEHAFAHVLTHAPAAPLETLESAASARASGGPSLFVIEGTLRFTFDEAAELAMTAKLAKPLARKSLRLRKLVDQALELEELPLGGTRNFAVDLVARIKRTWSADNRELPADFLESNAHEKLLADRAFPRRQVLGESHLRGDMVGPGDVSLPVFMSEACALHMPLSLTHEVRLVVEACPRQEESDATATSLRVIAVAMRA